MAWLIVVPALLAPAPAFGQDKPEPPATEPAAGLLQLFDARPGPLDTAAVAGLPAGCRPELLTWDRVYGLALIRARAEEPARSGRFGPDRSEVQSREAGVADFGRFRKDWADNQGLRDPAAAFLGLQARLARIEFALGKVARLERRAAVFAELGEVNPVSRADQDQLIAALEDERRGPGREVAAYRDQLDFFKLELGLAPDAAVALDASHVAPFREVFDQVDRWLLDPDRRLAELDRQARRLPRLGDVAVEGRPLLGEPGDDPARLDEAIARATRAANGGKPPADEAGDAAELAVRMQVRRLAEIRADYEAARRASVFAARQMGQAFEQVIAPPAAAEAGGGRSGVAVQALLAQADRIADNRSRLVDSWGDYAAARPAFDRVIGAFPYEDWASFLAPFSARLEPIGPALPEPTRPAAPPAAPPARPAPPPPPAPPPFR